MTRQTAKEPGHAGNPQLLIHYSVAHLASAWFTPTSHTLCGNLGLQTLSLTDVTTQHSLVGSTLLPFLLSPWLPLSPGPAGWQDMSKSTGQFEDGNRGQSARHKKLNEPFYLNETTAPTEEARMDELGMKSVPLTLANPCSKEKDWHQIFPSTVTLHVMNYMKIMKYAQSKVLSSLGHGAGI